MAASFPDCGTEFLLSNEITQERNEQLSWKSSRAKLCHKHKGIPHWGGGGCLLTVVLIFYYFKRNQKIKYNNKLHQHPLTLNNERHDRHLQVGYAHLVTLDTGIEIHLSSLTFQGRQFFFLCKYLLLSQLELRSVYILL